MQFYSNQNNVSKLKMVHGHVTFHFFHTTSHPAVGPPLHSEAVSGHGRPISGVQWQHDTTSQTRSELLVEVCDHR